jgi:hypothetical protein
LASGVVGIASGLMIVPSRPSATSPNPPWLEASAWRATALETMGVLLSMAEYPEIAVAIRSTAKWLTKR